MPPYLPSSVGFGGCQFGSRGGVFASSPMTYPIAVSSWATFPFASANWSSSTRISGEMPVFSAIQSPCRPKMRMKGTVREPPSIRSGFALIPISPPQVRVPISGPSPASRKA